MNNITYLEQYRRKSLEPDFLTQRVNGYYTERVEKTWAGGHIMHGKTPTEKDIQLMSNDYLSLSRHPEIVKAQASALTQGGNGMLMSGVFMDNMHPQVALEKRFARFLKAEDAVISQSGWCANVGLIQAITSETTPVYMDMIAHMSLWEGVRSAGATPYPFRHNDAEHLEKVIRHHGPGIIVIDSVYSTNGSVAPLRDIAAIAKQYNCVLIVDESHSLGTHGPNGAGLVVELGLEQDVHFRTASLAKAFSGRGGLVVGTRRNIEFFRYEARPAIFSSAVLPHETAGFNATLDIIQQDDWRRIALFERADILREGLLELGYNLNDSQSQIISLEAGAEEQTIILRDALEARGVFGSVFCAPATPKARSLIRFSVNATLSTETLDSVLKACKDVRDEVDMWNWPSTKRLQRHQSMAAHSLARVTTQQAMTA